MDTPETSDPGRTGAAAAACRVGTRAGEERATTPVWIARQPVVDRDERLVGYELLHRRSATAVEAAIDSPLAASTDVVAVAAVDIGMHRLVGPGSAFVNVTGGFLGSGRYRLLPPARTVLEVTEDQVVDDELRRLIMRARSEGYTIALDDYTLGSAQRPLLDLVDIVKVDLPLCRDGLEQVASQLRGSVRLLAEKVETRGEAERCRELGFELFQGFFFHRPQTVDAGRVTANRAAVLGLVAALGEPEVTIDDVAAVVRADATLSYKVLRLANSTWAGVRARVDDIADALALLGLDVVRQLVVVAGLLGSERKPQEVVRACIVRARACELASGRLRLGRSAHAFTAGVFSLAEPLCGKPITEVLADIPLPAPVAAALSNADTDLASLLRAVVAIETDRQQLEAVLDHQTITACYWEAVAWANEFEVHVRRA
jgi:EAL and modified HD-GYP domain-containing signal transduction protein